MATKSSTKNKSILKGTSAADVLTVKNDQVTVTGAGGNDTIRITKGNSSNVSGGAGKDTITVSAGKSHTIHGNAGNDTITIGKSAGTGIKAYGDAGNDSMKTTNSYAVTFYGGDGNDTITGGKGADKLYGQAGADKLYGGAGKDTLSGGAGDDRLYGQAGTDTLTGGAGKDTFVYANGGGSDKITDYAAGYDTLQITSGSISKTTLANSSKDMVITVGTGKVTLKNAAGKTISMKDNRGSYTMSKSAITLGSNFTGTMDSAKYLSTVTTINGKSSAKTVTIKGNAKANTIYGGSGVNTIYGNAGNDKLYGYAGNDTLSGGDGNDTLYGGAGTDALTGGAGKDTFVYANGEGSDTIKDYAAGQDTLYISSGSIAKTSLANSGKDLVITVGSGKVTLTNAATKAISLKDSRGNYTVSDTTITLGSDFTGTIDATKYLASVTTIDGRNAAKAVNITGNARDNIIYAGKAGGALSGSDGDDTLYGGVGEDTFVYAGGKETIYNYVSGSDTIKLSSTTLKSTSVSGEDTILNLANGGTITVKNAANADVLVVDSTGKSLTINNANAGDGSTVYGSDGADTFVYNVGEGNATIKDYKEGEDILQIADGEITKTEIVDGNVVLTVGDEGNTVTLEGAAGKSIEIHNSNGSLTLSENEISLGSDYTGDIDANAYLSTVTTIDGRNAGGVVNITGNSLDNTIYAGKAGGTINGGDGNDTLYGGDGNDTLTGGVGNDTFVYANGGGDDIITDYEEGQDVIRILDGTVGRVEFDYTYKQVVLTIGDSSINGSITIKGADNKTISVQDSRGSFSFNDKEVKLGSDFGGLISSGGFIASRGASTWRNIIGLIDGSDAEKYVSINVGENGAQVCTLYAGKAGSNLSGDGSIANTYNGGAGYDIFNYLRGTTTIYNYDYDKDYIQVDPLRFKVSSYGLNENGDFRLSISDKDTSYGYGSIIVKDVTKGVRYHGLTDGLSAVDMFNIDFIAGTEDADPYIEGTTGDDILLGFKGNDIVYGRAGNDTLHGGDDDDYLYGEAGKDILYGGKGKDYLYGGVGDDNLYGGDGNDILFGDAGSDTLNGGAGDDEIHGGTGNDTLYGGEGKDVFIYANGDGNDTIKDYQDGQDILQISNDTISKASIITNTNHYTDLIITIGENTVTLKADEADDLKEVNLKDSQGSFSLSRSTETITLGEDFCGTMDASKYLYWRRTIDGRKSINAISIIGDDFLNTIYAGKAGGTYNGGAGNDVLYGGDGDDTLYGGIGNDTFVYSNGGGNDIIKDYTEGEDVIRIADGTITSAEITGENINFIIGENSVTVEGGANKAITIQDENGSYTVSNQKIVIDSGYNGTINKFFDTPMNIEFLNVNSTDAKFDLEEYENWVTKVCIDTGNGVTKFSCWAIDKIKFADGIEFKLHRLSSPNSVPENYQISITDSNHIVFGTTGSQIINAGSSSGGCNNNRFYGFGDNDSLTAQNATNCYFSGGDGGDLLRMLNGNGNVLDGGARRDSYELWIDDKNRRFSVTIDNSTADDYKDLLVISDKTSSYYQDSFWDDFNFAKNDDGDLYITGRTFDAEIVIKDWDNHPMAKITFEGHNKTEEVIIEGNSIDNLVSMYTESQNIASAMASFQSSSMGLTMDSADIFGTNNSETSNMFITGNI